MRKRKKVYGILSLLLAFVMIIGNGEPVVLAETLAETVSENQASVSGADAEETVGEEDVSVSEEVAADVQTGVVGGNCGAEGDNLKWSLDLDTGVLTISGSGAMEDYGYDKDKGMEIIPPWFECVDYLNALILSEEITRIGNNAFEYYGGCGGELKLPDSLLEIGAFAFFGCSELSGELRLPDGLTKIGAYAFMGCSGFSGNLKLPEGLSEIWDKAFMGCSGFNGDLILPEQLTEIESEVFKNCSGFDGELKLPEGLTTIGACAFENCSGLNGELKFPESLEWIQWGAFRDVVDLVVS